MLQSDSRFRDIVLRHYDPETQLSQAKIEMIAGAIFSRSPGCNLLVFGLGNDSPFWHNLNIQGYTLFVENNKEWMERVLPTNPFLKAIFCDYAPVTVRRSLASPISILRRARPPEQLLERQWHVIIIDAPNGNRPHQPGRALPIAWAAQLAKPETHIFLDDYNRDVERSFANFLLINTGRRNYVVLDPKESKSSMLWSIGTADEFRLRLSSTT
jgi:hypothetical protein